MCFSKHINIVTLFFILLICSCSEFKLKEGDLLFQDLDSSPICDAIESVTSGYKNHNISHIGIIVKDRDSLFVLEAIPPKVQLSKLEKFLARSKDKNGNPKVMVGRLKQNFQHSIPTAIQFIKNQIDSEYDNEFIIKNNKYYCSELIYDAFKKDNIFQLSKMNFKTESGEVHNAWSTYFRKLNMSIPQDSLGINPANISKSNKINIVHFYGNITTKE